MNIAPVIVFNYNRPDHSRQTWKALSQNLLASDTDLYLYCDGPKKDASESVIQKIHEVHAAAAQYAKEAKEQGLFQNVYVVISEQNKGLANSIIGGVTDVIEKYGKVIVLEDDLITSPYFLKYMNGALDYYEEYAGVFSVSANRPPLEKMQIPEDYQYDVWACLRSYSTGWATWENRWNKVGWDIEEFEKCKKAPNILRAISRMGDDFIPMLQMQEDGKIDSWAVRFGLAHFKYHAVAILPCNSYVSNIGFDGTGTHSGLVAKEYENDLTKAVVAPRWLDFVYEDERIINAFYSRFCATKRPLWQRVINTIARKIGKRPPFTIKKKVYA